MLGNLKERFLSYFNKNLGSSQRYTAFTLAEVLIVLGIIGIVAAMTIPTLVNKVEKQEYVAGLKKFYTTQMNGWSKLLADEGVSQLDDTSVFQSMGGDYCGAPDATTASCSTFYNNLKKYFKFNIIIAPSYKIHFLNGQISNDYTGRNVYVFADGTIGFDQPNFSKVAEKPTSAALAQIDAGGYRLRALQSSFWVDVNGFKKPNVIGRDIFMYNLSSDGKLYPERGKDEQAFFGHAGQSWLTSASACGTKGSSDASASYGYCSARIMEEGWQMNY